jgi:hypothetical protein
LKGCGTVTNILSNKIGKYKKGAIEKKFKAKTLNLKNNFENIFIGFF